MLKIKTKKKRKKNPATAPLGRPPLPESLRREYSLRFRMTQSESDLLELASRFCNFPQRSRWAITRLLILARSVVRKSGTDPDDAKDVKSKLQKIPKVA